MADDSDLAFFAALRSRMETELVELAALRATHQEDSAPVDLDQQSVGRLSRMDAMQRQAMAVASEARRATRIEALRRALERVATGEYGRCFSCDEPIATGRLDADPTVLLCVTCARRAEL